MSDADTFALYGLAGPSQLEQWLLSPRLQPQKLVAEFGKMMLHMV
jgi:hypothetical protein